MRILYLIPSEPIPSSYARFVHSYELASHITKLGHHVLFFARSPYRYRLCRIVYRGLDIRYVRYPTGFRPWHISFVPMALLSNSKIKTVEREVDVIQERLHVPLLFAPNVKKPLVLEVNNPYVEEHFETSVFRGIAYSNRRKQFERCSALITQTETLKKILSAHTGKETSVIPNGVNTSLFRPDIASDEIKRQYGTENCVTVTYAGSLERHHGMSLIPLIAKTVIEKHANVKFFIVGSGPCYKDLHEGLSGKLRKHVILTGPQRYEVIPKFLASSDVLLAPFDTTQSKSLEKYGFWWCPLKLFEYMASGKSIVSFDFFEVRKIVRDAGLLAKPRDVKQFIEYLLWLIEDHTLRKRLGSKGREIAEKEYTWEKRAEQVTKVYEKVLQGKPC